MMLTVEGNPAPLMKTSDKAKAMEIREPIRATEAQQAAGNNHGIRPQVDPDHLA